MHHHHRYHVLSSSSSLPYHHGLLKSHHICTNLLFIHAYYYKQKRPFFSPNSSNGSSKGGPQRIFSIRQSLAAIDKKMLLKHTIIFIIGTDIDEVNLFVLQQGIYHIAITIIIDNIDTITSYRTGAVLGYLFEQLMVKDMLLSLYYYISSLILRIVDSIYSLIRWLGVDELVSVGDDARHYDMFTYMWLV